MNNTKTQTTKRQDNFAMELGKYCDSKKAEKFFKEDLEFFAEMVAIARSGRWPNQQDIDHADSDPRDFVVELINKHKNRNH